MPMGGQDEGPGRRSPADLIERARRASLFYRASYEGTDPHQVRLPAAAGDELIQGIAAGVDTELCQIVPFAAAGQSSQAPFSRAVWRQLAARCVVQRLYLVPTGGVDTDEVDRQIVEDRHHKLQAFSVPISLAGEMATVPMNDMWLIDRSVVVRQETGTDGLASWVVTGNSEEVDRARRLWEELMGRRCAPTAVARQYPAGPELTRWILRSASMLYAMAPMSCTASHFDRKSCVWYHSAWQYLRLFDMVSSPNWHATFYATQLVEAVRGGARRILISGAADYTMLAFVLDAARAMTGRLPDDLDVHALDLCETPLLACRWYAAQVGAEVTVHRRDITRPDQVDELADDGFDLVVTDAFLTRFDRRAVDTVLQSWSRLLRPGGRVITTVRLHPENEWPRRGPEPLDEDGEATEEEPQQGGQPRMTNLVDDFELRFRERAAGWRTLLPVELEELSRAARRYAAQMTSNDLGDAAEVQEAFRRSGFRLSTCDVGRVGGELVGTEYIRLTADSSSDRTVTSG
ncbi:class I SAM-dependent methyltransferase [Micromonospora sp.]|uniref:class I SAM-dependent methyltransferase n=1 Tax=Micromonospora sp. TaxID=1876 RepID=UPI003B3B56B7